MDQDAFRNLLGSSRQSQPNAKQGGIPTTANNIRQSATTSASSGPAFKPRKVNKSESKYRDRAAERREGVGNDYAQVEAVLEDFEKRAAHEDKHVIEQQRKYLGGDSQHTILVKGLDMSLLEQNRARVAASTEDDEILEQAFAEATSTSEPAEPRKRTREDIIRDLKAKQQTEDRSANQPVVEKSLEDDGLALEAAKKKNGKFRPIGFKPIGQTEEKSKKRKVKEEKEGMKKKKKQKTESVSVQSGQANKSAEETSAVTSKRDNTKPSPSKTPKKPPEPEPTTLMDEDFDIFADARDYEGFQGDEESEDCDAEETEGVSALQGATSPTPAVGFKGWFDEPEREDRHDSILPEMSPPIPDTAATEEEPEETHLKPLESSAISSIRDFLAMDEATERAEKRKARKEKKKKKKKAGGEDDEDD